MERLRHIRDRAGYSQQELADESGVSQHTISEIELGRRKPQGRTLRKLADILGVKVADFFPKAPAPPPDPNAQRRREFLEHIKTLDRAALEALSEEIGKEDARVRSEWERAKEADAPEFRFLSTQLEDVSARGMLVQYQIVILDNPNASFGPVQRQMALVGAA